MPCSVAIQIETVLNTKVNNTFYSKLIKIEEAYSSQQLLIFYRFVILIKKKHFLPVQFQKSFNKQKPQV